MNPAPPPRKLLDQMSDCLRTQHYSARTEQSYVEWVRRYILFHQKRHPKDMGAPEVKAFLTHLALERKVAASTQNQALSALLFLYREVLNQPLSGIDAVRARQPGRLPTVLTKSEATRVLNAMTGTPQLMARLLYGSGLRAMECLRLRVKDLDFEQRQIIVRDGKGEKDRITMLPDSLIAPLRDHLRRVQQIHQQDLAAGYGRVHLPYALAVKYPNAAQEWAWQYVFPARSRSIDPRTGVEQRHHPLKVIFRKRSTRPHAWPASPTNRSVPIRFVIRSRPICWKPGTTFAPFKNCSATKTLRRP